jgi:hypothetical protein
MADFAMFHVLTIRCHPPLPERHLAMIDRTKLWELVKQIPQSFFSGTASP